MSKRSRKFGGVSLIAALLAVILPVVLVQPAAAISIAVRISDQSTEVAPMDRVYFEVEIKYPENLERKDLRVTTELKQGGKVIATAKGLRAVETQVSFLDYIVVPASAKSGSAEVDVTVEDYNGLREEAASTFTVTSGDDKLQLYFFILLATIVVIGIVVSVQIMLLAKRRAAKR
jgi:hypothetical protein